MTQCLKLLGRLWPLSGSFNFKFKLDALLGLPIGLFITLLIRIFLVPLNVGFITFLIGSRLLKKARINSLRNKKKLQGCDARLFQGRVFRHAWA